jgi:hypothetical protein
MIVNMEAGGAAPTQDDVYVFGSSMSQALPEVARLVAALEDPSVRGMTIRLTKTRLRDAE